MQLEDQDIQFLIQCWAGLSDYPASEAHASRNYALNRLCDLIGADMLYWVGTAKTANSTRADMLGPLGHERLSGGQLDKTGIANVYTRQMQENYKSGRVDRFSRSHLAAPGRCVCHRPIDLMSLEEWHDDWFFKEVRQTLGLGDIMIGTYRLKGNVQSHIGMERCSGRVPFSRRDRTLLQCFMAGAVLWHCEQLLASGLAHVEIPLRERERDVLYALLTNASEKQIADQLGLTIASTHQYITSIFRNFGVSGRRGLMALFLRYDGLESDK